ncbi:hypothetical protein [Paraliomyxa miuraensis]|uniref:hypothetical protein n=1 Tax=Paraliomyxa miuraensis TaxID=376150 RepID=UPI002250A088|nr:hypothetical protein [Paraliomyxa miuraensis]MCX4247320.1 hypothetical protein [Paraliomyxa miuraensis]
MARSTILLPTLLLATLPACVEIDPSYADSYTTTISATTDPSTTDPTASSTTAPDDSSGTPACDCEPFQLCEAGTCTAPSRILFVNLDGVTATFGAANASQDSHNLYPELAGTWDGYGADDATRQTLLSTITTQWEPFRVVVTDQRPPAGSAPYLQAVVTATPPPAGFEGVASIAFPDCGDAIPQDMSFVFAQPGDAFGVSTHANWVSLAFARGLGLQYTNAADDLSGFGDRFVETCYPIAEATPCAAHHPEYCNDDPMQQSSLLELQAILGARG